jgi:hypothetical protein
VSALGETVGIDLASYPSIPCVCKISADASFAVVVVSESNKADFEGRTVGRDGGA